MPEEYRQSDMTINTSSMIRLREPGLGQQWIGKERYVVKAGAVIAVPLMMGDEIEIVDPEGLQSAHVFAFDVRSNITTAKLGVRSGIDGNTLCSMLDSDSPGASKIRNKLKSFSVDLANAEVAEVLAGETVAGTSVTLVSEGEMICLIGAPGKPMRPDQHNTVTDLVAFITRANPGCILANELPEPLADENQSIRIDAATAQSYEVKAGEFIQIIDVDGRQCSDFQCFDARALERSKTRNLSATTTRSLMGMPILGQGCIRNSMTSIFNRWWR